MKKRIVPKYPGNQKKLRPIKFTDLPDPVLLCPTDAKNLNIACQNGHKFKPPWRDKMPFEFSPIESADGYQFVLQKIPIKCPECGFYADFTFPSSAKNMGTVDLYGDESYHWNENKTELAYFYCFFSLLPEGKQQICKEISDIKSTIRPLVDPEMWFLHAAEMRGSRWRQKYGVSLSGHEVDAQQARLACAIGGVAKNRFIFVAAAPSTARLPNQSQHECMDAVRERLISSAIMSSTDILTRQGFSPRFILEQVERRDDDKFMDYMTEKIGRGLHYSLAFHYVSRGKMVGLPSQTEKNNCVELECSDLVAFWVQRYFAKTRIKRDPEVPLESFGKILWGGFLNRVYAVFPSIGFPHEKFKNLN